MLLIWQTICLPRCHCHCSERLDGKSIQSITVYTTTAVGSIIHPHTGMIQTIITSWGSATDSQVYEAGKLSVSLHRRLVKRVLYKSSIHIV